VVQEEKLYDENGQEIEFEGDIIEEDPLEQEEVVQRDGSDEDGEWEDEDESDQEEDGAGGKREVWDESKAPL
jgi:hypothetical protein